MPILKTPENPKNKTAPTPFKIGDRVCCPDEYGLEILEVVKINPFDEEWLWAKADFWVKPDYFHIHYLRRSE
jgi:hypothetical protein